MLLDIIRMKICATSAGIKKYKSITKKKKKKHDETVLLGKEKLNTIVVLIYKVLFDWYMSHDEFVSVNNVLREYYEMKKEIKILKPLLNIVYKNNRNVFCQL